MRRSIQTLVMLLFWCVVLAPTLTAGGSMARHKRLFAVPRPGPVQIDGRLDDWDLSGQILVYVLAETSASQSARFAVMYDADALYLSGVMRDSTPMMNRHDPNVEAHLSWDADACQFRLILDPSQAYPATDTKRTKKHNDQLARMTLWYYTDRQEPNLLLAHGMRMTHLRAAELRGGVPHDKFQAAYLPAADKLGYTFEYRIPWSTLGARHPPSAGDLVAANVQFNFSRPDGLKTAGRSAWAYDLMRTLGFPYKDARCWGKLIFSAHGNLAPDLVEEGVRPPKPLPLNFAYDLPEEAEVTVALYDRSHTLVRNIAVQSNRLAGHVVERWDGRNEIGRPVKPGLYTWKGLYHQPLTTRFVMSVHNSGKPPYKTDNNRGGWGGDHGNPRDIAIAGDVVILTWDDAEAGWGIIRTNLDGRKRWGSRGAASYAATDGVRCFTAGGGSFNPHGGVNALDVKTGKPLNFGNGATELLPPGAEKVPAAAVTGLTCNGEVVYVAYAGRDLVAAFDGVSGALKTTFPVAAPGRLAVAADGRLLVISRDRVMVVTRAGATPFASVHIDHPAGVAVAPDGTVAVANRGRLQNVSVFTAAGQYLRSIGKAGGRPRRGAYDPTGMLEPGGMAIDHTGALWVAEALDAPKRISVWDLADGKLHHEFFGGCQYATFVSIDPARPDEAYCHNVLWSIDLDKGVWHPKATSWRQLTPLEIHQTGCWGYNGHARMMSADNGQQFAWGMWDYGHVLSIRDDNLLKPFAAAIRVYRKDQRWQHLYPVIKDDPRHYPDGAYLWQDANNDQSVQAEEVTPAPFAARAGYLLNWVDHDLRLWCDSGHYFDPVRFDGKRPVYNFTEPRQSPFAAGNSNLTSLWAGRDDALYSLFKRGGPPLAKWTRDGRLLWAVTDVPSWRQALSRPLMKPGKVWGPTMPLGEAGEFTGIATYFGPFQLFTRDGIAVGMVFRDSRLGGVGADVIACEAFSGQLIQPAGTNRYYILAGDQDGRITEILGLDTVKRLPGGTYRITSEMAQQAMDARRRYADAQAAAAHLVIGRLEPGRAVGKDVDETRGFTATAAYTQKELIVRFDVRTPAPLVNGIADPSIIFKGGNLLDIQMATDPAADPGRKKPAPGDLRLLISRHNEKPVAVLYQPRIAGFSGKRTVLRSPTGQEPFDAIRVVDDVRLRVTARANGFQATVCVPLTTLNWRPEPGGTVRMDLGYIFGNKTGTATACRRYWSNNSFTANVVGDIPNESRLEPDQWGDATIE